MRFQFNQLRFDLRYAWSDFLHAVQFLTRLPVDRWVPFDPGAMPRCAAWFPVVGAAVGLASSIAYAFTRSAFPLPIAVLFAMLTSVLITGAMHEDGLADAADGLCGHALPNRAMEIMRDSRIGSYGAVALAFLLAFRFMAIASFDSPWTVLRILVAAAALGRASSVFLISTCLNLRTDSPTSQPFSGGLDRRALTWCLGGTVAVSVLLLGFHLSPIIASVTATLALRQFFVWRLGGITGDCLGAAIALTELAVLVLST